MYEGASGVQSLRAIGDSPAPALEAKMRAMVLQRWRMHPLACAVYTWRLQHVRHRLWESLSKDRDGCASFALHRVLVPVRAARVYAGGKAEVGPTGPSLAMCWV